MPHVIEAVTGEAPNVPHQDKLAELEAKLKAVESRLAALESRVLAPAKMAAREVKK